MSGVASEADPLQQGVAPPPPGVTPNFKHPVYQSCGIYPITAVFLALSTIFLLLRLYTKARIIKVFGAEDYVLVMAWLLNIVTGASILVTEKYGTGKHLWEIRIIDFLKWVKWGDAVTIMYIPAVGLAKVAILLFYLRINPDRKFRLTVFFVMFFTIGYMIALCLATFFQCRPVDAFWNPAIKNAKCLDTARLYTANAILNVITDFMTLLIPVPMLAALRVGLKQKLLVWSVFATGSLACIFSATRAYYVSKLGHSKDSPWDIQLPTVFTVVEGNLTVICSAIMLLRPLLRRYFPTLFSAPGEKASSGGLGGGAAKKEEQKKVKRGADGSYTIFDGKDSGLTGTTVTAGGTGNGSRRAKEEGYALESLNSRSDSTNVVGLSKEEEDGLGYGLGIGAASKKRSGVGSHHGGDEIAGDAGGGRSWFDAQDRSRGNTKSESKERIVDVV